MLQREGVLSPERAMGFISPLASALDAAHAAGLVHRDVKPANILVDARPGRPEHVYLSDFGIAKAEMSASITEPGKWIGTPAYSAPERAMPSESETGPLTVSGGAAELYRALRAPARQPAATSRTAARHRRKARQLLAIGLPVALLAAAAAVAIVAVTRNAGTTGSIGDSGSNLTSEGTFTGYAGQRGAVTVDSITEADGTSLAAGIADGHPAIWRGRVGLRAR